MAGSSWFSAVTVWATLLSTEKKVFSTGKVMAISSENTPMDTSISTRVTPESSRLSR